MGKTVTVTRGSGLLEGFLAKKRTAKANSLLKPVEKGRILDIGCGSYPYFLLNTNFDEKYGIDPSLNSSVVNDINLKKLEVTKQKLPFKDSFFDAVTMLAVFEHIDFGKIPFVLKEIRRVLGKDGVLTMTTPSPLGHKVLHVMARMNLVSPEEIHEHKHHYNKDTIEKMLKEAGFEENNVKSGYFEMGVNMWFMVKK